MAQVVQFKQYEMGGPPIVGTLHSVFRHNFLGALAMGLVLGLFGFKSARWWIGCILGALTHVGLDMIVHADVAPVAPWSMANPFFMDGAYGVVSIALMFCLAIWVLDLIDQRRKI